MTNADQSRSRARVPEAEQGGDPVCWLHLVCPECGRFTGEDDAAGPTAPGGCPECGAEPSG